MPTPTGNEDLNGALTMAQQICWDESHGYTIGADMNPDTDCSGLVGYCLSHNGFNVPQRWDTTNMIPTLQNYAGFTEYIYDSSFVPQHGDIFVYDEGGGQYGHTFFYAENVSGYTDSTGRTATIGPLAHAKIEASSSRESGYEYPDRGTIPGDINNPDEPGDHRRNNVGAYWEVWVHAYETLASSGHTWHVFRWQGETPPPPPTGGIPKWLLLSLINNNNRQDGGR